MLPTASTNILSFSQKAARPRPIAMAQTPIERLRFGQRAANFRPSAPDNFEREGGMASLEGLIATVTGSSARLKRF